MSQNKSLETLLPGQWKFNPPDNMRIVDVRSIQELKPHADAWAELLLQSTAASPMLSYPWISAYFETKVLPTENWLCLFAYEDNRLIGVLPLITGKSISFLGWSVIVFETPYNVYHTTFVDCLAQKGHEDVLELFVDYLSHIPRVFSAIRIKKIPEHSSSMIYLKYPGKNICVIPEQSGTVSVIPISGTYDDYLNSLSSKFRKKLRRKGRRLDEVENVRYLLCEKEHSAEENIKRFVQVEGSGWKGRKKTSIEARKGDADLLSLAARRLNQYGWVEWNFIEAGNKTIVADFNSRIKRTLYLMKTGFNE